MSNYNERNRKSVKQVLLDEKTPFDIYRNPQNNNIACKLNGNTNVGIDKRLKAIIETVADSKDEAEKFAAMKEIARNAYFCELQECDEHGNPVVKGIDPNTGEAMIAEWVPCLVMNTVSANTLMHFDAGKAAKLFED